MIRTEPKERGFAYISGCKRQAGQDRNLIEEGVASAAINTQRTALDALEAAAVKKTAAKRTLTELEELEGLVKLNQKANAAGKDVDHNASIRKAFRMDRREKRKKLVEGKKLGWKKGMALLKVDDSDILLSKEAAYGNASVEERTKLSKVRESSIFESAKKRKRRKSSRNNSTAPDTVNSGATPDSVLSSREHPEATPDEISSSMNAAPPASILRKKKLVVTNGSVRESNNESTGQEETPSSFLDLVGGYGSSSDEDD